MLTLDRILDDIRPSVVTVYAHDGPGLGFIIDPLGWVLTKQSIVSRNPRVSILFHNGHRERGVAVGTDGFSDLAAIYFKPSEPVEAFTLVSSHEVQLARTAISLRFAPNDAGVLRTPFVGYISELRTLLDPKLPILKGLSAVRAVGNLSNPADVKANRVSALESLGSLDNKLPILPEYVEIRSSYFEKNTIGDLLINPLGRLVGLVRFTEVRYGLAFPPVWNSENSISSNHLRLLLPHLQNFYDANYLEVTVPAGEKIKVTAPLIQNDHELAYSVVVDQDDLGFAVLDPSDTPLMHHGKISQVANIIKPGQAGIYNFLLDNSHSVVTSKNVFLAYRRVNPTPKIPTEADLSEFMNYVYDRKE